MNQGQQLRRKYLGRLRCKRGTIRTQVLELDRGASLVELAFVLPILALLFVGLLDFGKAYYLSIEVSSAARAGAQYGVLHPTDKSGMQYAAVNDAPDVSGISATATIGCECSDGTNVTQSSSSSDSCPSSPSCSSSAIVINYVKVTTTATYTPLVRWPGLPTSLTLQGQSMMRTGSN